MLALNVVKTALDFLGALDNAALVLAWTNRSRHHEAQAVKPVTK
jgi:hypothetical protein